jgi:cell division transport system permease protein
MLILKKYFMLQTRSLMTALINIKNQPVAAIVTSMMIGFILTWPTFLWVMSLQAKHVIQDWHQSAYFTYYIPNQLDSKSRDAIILQLQRMAQVQDVKVITPEQSLKKLLKKDETQQLSLFSMQNPLPYVVEVFPKLSMFSAEALQAFNQEIAKIPHLNASKNDLNWYERLSALEKFLSHLSMILLAMLVIGVSFLISNTLRMVIHSRYEEIQVLKLIGATHQYILTPFLFTGAIYGLLGALFAVFAVDSSILFVQGHFQPLAALYDYSGKIAVMNIQEVMVILGTALILGWGAAWIFVRHYLNSIEPV